MIVARVFPGSDPAAFLVAISPQENVQKPHGYSSMFSLVNRIGSAMMIVVGSVLLNRSSLS